MDGKQDDASARPLLDIRLLGGFHITDAGQPLNTVNQARVQSLFAYLLLHRQTPQARPHLAYTFWPDADEAHARNNLRQMLHYLRHSLPRGSEFLLADASTVQWSPTASYRLDVADFEEAAARAARLARADDKAGARHALQAAIAYYRGDLLPGCYDDWIGPERERLRLLAFAVCRQLIHLLEEQRDYTAAIEVGRRLLQLDPLEEAAYLALMRLHALNNDRAGALRVYHECVTIMQRELEVGPGEEVQAAYERLLHLETQAAPTMVQPPSSSNAIPLVGRQAEWAQLRTVWQQSARGQPALALITGEPGIGKTRLAEELFEWATRQGIAAARTRAYAVEGRLSYAPLAEWLRSPAIAPSLARLDPVWLRELARLLPEMIDQRPDLPPPEPLVELWQRRHFFEALARGVLAGAAPLLLLFDDLQWCDQETLEWLHFLLRFDSKARLLVLGTVRSEELAANGALLALTRALARESQLHELALTPLDAADVANLAGKIAERPLASAEAAQLMQATEGVPLFVVEMVRAGFAAETAQPASRREVNPSIQDTPALSALPPKMYAVIAGRLEQLSPAAREVLGAAAAIGRAFLLDVLVHASGRDEETVIDALEEMWQRRLIREQAANLYDFSHDKLRDVAYREISPIQARRLHRRVAEALLVSHAANLDAVHGQVAAHYEQAGLAEQAVRHHREAAAAARRLLAHEEAIGHLQRGLALLASLPTTVEQQRQTLALLMALGTLLAAVKGNAALEVREVYTEALQLCRRVGEPGQTFVAQQELRICYGQRGELAVAEPLAEENLVLAATLDSGELLRYAHLGVAVVRHAQGQLALARVHFDQALAQPVVPSGGFDPLFFDSAMQGSLRHSALTLWLLGYPEQARTRMEQALVLGAQHPQSVRYGMTLYFAAMLHHYGGETHHVQLRAEQLKALSAAHGYAFHAVSGAIFAAWALVRQRQEPAAILQLHQSLEARKASGHRLFLPYELGLLCEAYLQAGDTAAGLAAVQEALAVVAETGERVWQAELLRLRAELLAAQGAPADEVEALLRQALQLAEQQAARALQLRAAASLARVWQGAGKSDDARRLLAPIYASLTEGFDTLDVQQARALLAELSA